MKCLTSNSNGPDLQEAVLPKVYQTLEKNLEKPAAWAIKDHNTIARNKENPITIHEPRSLTLIIQKYVSPWMGKAP